MSSFISVTNFQGGPMLVVPTRIVGVTPDSDKSRVQLLMDVGGNESEVWIVQETLQSIADKVAQASGIGVMR